MGSSASVNPHSKQGATRPRFNDAVRGYQEKGVNNHVEVERWKQVARVVVAPEADLHRDDDGRVEQQGSAAKQHPWGSAHTSDLGAKLALPRVMTDRYLA